MSLNDARWRKMTQEVRVIEFFFNFLRFCVGSINKWTDVCLSMQIQDIMFLSVAAHR